MLPGKVIDGDGHVLEPPALWRQYLETKYKDRAIRMEKDQTGVEYLIIDGRPSARLRGMGPAVAGNGQDYQKLCKSGNFGYFDGPKGAYEPQARLRHMDEQGIDAAVLFPSLGLAWECEVDDAGLAAAYARAYNNWILDFASADRSRLVPIALITLKDLDQAVAEVRRTAKLGAKGAFMRAAPITQIPWWDPIYDPFWAALEETGLPVGMHVATNEYFLGHQWKLSDPVMSVNSALHFYRQTCIQFDVQAAFASMCLGVFDRFPRLKVLLLETGCGWIAHFLERLDAKHRLLGWKTDMKQKPSEYFRRQCWISADPEETTLPAMIEWCGPGRFLWASDFPHFDASPEPVKEIKAAVASMPADIQQKILGDNAAEAYQLS